MDPINWIVKYVQEAKEEIAKISWPTRDNTIKYSLVVIGLCLVLAVFFAGLDGLLNLGLQKFITLKK